MSVLGGEPPDNDAARVLLLGSTRDARSQVAKYLTSLLPLSYFWPRRTILTSRAPQKLKVHPMLSRHFTKPRPS